MAIREIRVCFNDKELELYNYIDSKSSKSGFLKDIAKIEMCREQKYIFANSANAHPQEKQVESSSPTIGKAEEQKAEEVERDEDQYGISLSDFSDIGIK